MSKTISTNPSPREYRLGDVIKNMKTTQLNNLKISGYDQPWANGMIITPARQSDYIWRETLVRDLAMFWYSGAIALKAIGHTGTGKTETILQWHSAFNLPVIAFTANPKTEAQQLVGQYVVSETGGMKFIDGPLVTAAKLGITLLIDEYNLADPGEMAGLNAFLEGRPYTVPETQETVTPSAGFRVIVTMNPKGHGYRGRQQQDLSNDDRFVDIEVTYMSEAAERELVAILLDRLYQPHPRRPDPSALSQLSIHYARCAKEIRHLYMGLNDRENAIPCTLSTRGLLKWVEWSEAARLFLPDGCSSIHYALARILSNRQRPEVKEALHQVVAANTGEHYTPELIE